MKGSLKFKIALMCGAMAVIMAICLGICAIALSTSALKSTYRSSMIQNAEDMAALVTARIDSELEVLDSIVRRPAIASEDYTVREKIESLKEDAQVAKSKGVLRYGIADRNGRTYMTNGASSDVSERDYFKASMNGKPFVTTPMMAKSDGAWIMICSEPIRNQAGQVYQVLFVVMNGDFISDVLSSMKRDADDNLWIIDSEGTTIADADFNNVVNGENLLKSAETDAGYLPIAALYEQALHGSTDAAVYKYTDGETFFCGFAPLEERGWYIFSEINYNSISKKLTHLMLNICVIAFFLIIIFAVVAVFVGRSLGQKMEFVEGVLRRMAEGDYISTEEEQQASVSILKRNDEIGRMTNALEEMQSTTVNLVENITSSVDQITAGNAEISSASQSISTGASEQASSSEEISTQIQNITFSIAKTADNTRNAIGIADSVVQSADSGAAAVQDTLDMMKKIADRVKIIESVAAQTNRLALNAAIEAARAGESGRGFAVVAGEVRKLAERSQTAAAEITDLSSQSLTVAENANEKISHIVEEISKTAAIIREIANECDSQNAEVMQINSGIRQMDSVIQQNASASEQLASMAEELGSQSMALKETIGFFKIEEQEWGGITP